MCENKVSKLVQSVGQDIMTPSTRFKLISRLSLNSEMAFPFPPMVLYTPKELGGLGLCYITSYYISSILY